MCAALSIYVVAAQITLPIEHIENIWSVLIPLSCLITCKVIGTGWAAKKYVEQSCEPTGDLSSQQPNLLASYLSQQIAITTQH